MADQPFASVAKLEAYAESTIAPIYYLLLEFMDIKSVDCDHACSHVAKAQGIANFIRSTPYSASRGKCLMPQDLLVKVIRIYLSWCLH